MRTTSKRLALPAILLASVYINFACIDIGNAVHAQFKSLEPGLTVSEITNRIGQPDNLVGEITTVYGQHVVVWEYEKTTARIILPIEHRYYWLYMVDGHFWKYSPRGDWKRESNILYHTDCSKPPHE